MPENSPELDTGRPPNEPPIEAQKPGGSKARLKTLEDLDGRTKARQNAEEMRRALIEDFGGEEKLTRLDLEQIESVALNTAVLRDLQVRAHAGEEIDPTRMATCENVLNRTIERLNAGPGSRTSAKKAGAPAPPMRNVARAILAVLREARLEDTPEGEPTALPVASRDTAPDPEPADTGDRADAPVGALRNTPPEPENVPELINMADLDPAERRMMREGMRDDKQDGPRAVLGYANTKRRA